MIFRGPPTANDAIDVVVTRVDASPEQVRASTALLSDSERKRASRFAFARDRHRFVVARAKLRQLLANRLGMPPHSIELTYGAHGKPALAKSCGGSELHFNVSHSNDIAVYAFSRGRDIGVDVEHVRVLRDADDIAAHFFSRRENTAYLALRPSERPCGFFNCWTRKEAFIKALGEGLHYSLDRFDVSLAPGEPARILSVEGMSGERCGWTLDSFLPGPGLVGAVAIREDRLRVRRSGKARPHSRESRLRRHFTATNN